MLFAHLKRIIGLDRLRLRGPNGAKDEFHLAATVQNLRKLAKLCPESASLRPSAMHASSHRRMPQMPDQTNLAGMAALSICEELLLAINHRKLLPENKIVGVPRNAAATHANVAGPDAETHRAIAALINRITAGGH
jgi:hypothetical protein